MPEPCPFCGYRHSVREENKADGYHWRTCKYCHARGPRMNWSDYADEAWNARGKIPVPPAKGKEMR